MHCKSVKKIQFLAAIRVSIFKSRFSHEIVFKNSFMLISVSPLQHYTSNQKVKQGHEVRFKKGKRNIGFVWGTIRGCKWSKNLPHQSKMSVLEKFVLCSRRGREQGNVCVCRCASAVQVNIYSCDCHYFGKPFVFPSQTLHSSVPHQCKKKAPTIAK